MTALQAFQNDKELLEQLDAVVKKEWWAKCLAYAKAEMMSMEGITMDHLQGALRLEKMLTDLVKSPESVGPWPGSGLEHNLESTTADKGPLAE